MNNSDLNILFDAIKLVESKVYRDFSEIENLQNSYSSAIVFAKKTLEFLNNKFLDFFLEKRQNYNIVIKGQDDIKIDKNINRTIYINSISGIMNFSHAMPYFCTTITVKERIDGEDVVLCGVVNNYATQELFFVEKNKGCFLKGKFNDFRLRVSNRPNIENSIISVKCDSKKEKIKKIIDKIGTFRVTGCSILDMVNVASGKYDASFIYEKNIFDLDLGLLFVKEAGGNSTELKDKCDVLLSNSLIFSEIKKLLI